MKIRALALLYGPHIAAKAGDIVIVDDLIGRGLVEAGAAAEIPTTPVPPVRKTAPFM